MSREPVSPRSTRGATIHISFISGGDTPARGGVEVRRTIPALMTIAALTLLAASAIHSGLLGPIDPFAGAAIPEAVIGVVLGIAAVVAWSSSGAWVIALAATLFAIAGTLFGLTITVPRGDPGDVVYHLSLLGILAIVVGLLVAQRRRT